MLLLLLLLYQWSSHYQDNIIFKLQAAVVVAEGTSIGVHLGMGCIYQINEDCEMDNWLLQETSLLFLADRIQWLKLSLHLMIVIIVIVADF